VRGRTDDPPWVRPALLTVLGASAILYVWRLSESGWANDFYSAAVQAGAQSWKAFFFGSSDAANFITVDKTPAFLWPMDLAARIFGVNSWSILVPQALEGVATVGLLYLTVRRWFGPGAGLLAGAVLAVTPVATLMFRYNNPDALLTLLLTAGAYAVVRAVETGSTRWIVLAGSLVGWAFLAKMLQALLVVPAFGLVFLVAAPLTLWRRVWRLLVAGVAMVASAGWWVAVVELWPKDSRPYIGGSQDNSMLNLIFGYNGFGRLNGRETGSVGGGAVGTAGRWGATGIDRLFNTSFGGQISWLLPAALVLLVVLLVLSASAPWTDRTRAATLLWGGWLLVTGLAISLGQGIIHPYYTVALAPAIGALVGMGTAELWRQRHHLWARLIVAATVALTGWWAHALLARRPGWYPNLRTEILVGSLVAAVALAIASWERTLIVGTIAAGALVAVLAGPTSYAFATVDTAHSGALPTAGPTGVAFTVHRMRPTRPLPTIGSSSPHVGTRPVGPPGRVPVGGPNGPLGPLGGPVTPWPPAPSTLPTTPSTTPSTAPSHSTTSPTTPWPGGHDPGTGSRTGGRGSVNTHVSAGSFGRVFSGGVGGILDANDPPPAVTKVLLHDADRYTWVAAAVSSNQAAGYQLATRRPVMAIGGFNGTDPAPTLKQFQQLVDDGRIHYLVAGLRGGIFGGRAQTSRQIVQWVEDHFKVIRVENLTLYDLTLPVHDSGGPV
jgi:4-amino-4-deoxy-L-arabinose transferase-like glycosyltransferase